MEPLNDERGLRLHHGQRSKRNDLCRYDYGPAEAGLGASNGVADGFTKRYGCKQLVWYEVHDGIENARLRELQMKKWNRQWKLTTIELMNPDWRDLFETVV